MRNLSQILMECQYLPTRQLVGCGVFFTGLLGYSAFLLLRAHTTGPLWREAFTLCANLRGASCHGDRFSRIQNCSGSDVHGLLRVFVTPLYLSALSLISIFAFFFPLFYLRSPRLWHAFFELDLNITSPAQIKECVEECDLCI